MAQSVESTRLLQAIQGFQDRQPRDLPDGVVQALEAVQKGLSESDPGTQSPGEREAYGEHGTGEHFSRAAKGTDQPSPGQREANAVIKKHSLSDEIDRAAAEIVERVQGGAGPAKGD